MRKEMLETAELFILRLLQEDFGQGSEVELLHHLRGILS